ncbi:TadE/TadG family type IV pilus assembly protein [Aureimonas jatrophae]|uniref:Flp pilus assembly protein TadG n=1 Tax=Aureimonas jatrophae TaxID=1166073 RepID=A0A1H0CHU2_9HYPH|nr:TadE/TadG family type IV pilus assembly protein [Aureimonas jatrophae]MBB3949240.1 Flp pilus assembly protein TadG [Aureimonas jatrophae]SDN57467.1 Flp pilus assembly protein TadG [Aureimonas jatrophae]
MRPSSRFLRDHRASIPIVTALLLPVLVLISGGAVDLVVHERGRIALQDALDRGVLAAASLNQTADPTAVVRSFLKSVPNGDTATLTVAEQKTLNKRVITASASIAYETTFLKLADIDDLTINASSTAEESRSNVELSLVLDISGSMLDNGGMTQLRPAAKSFLDVVLKEDSRPTTSVNIIPFAGQVNVGKDVFEYITSAAYNNRLLPYGRKQHNSSWCVEMTSGDFSSGTPSFYDRDQAPHFSYYNISASGKQPWWCPTLPTISYMTNDLATLKARMDALQPYDGTGTAYGMKWAELLLNPSMRSTLQSIRTKGYAPIPASFSARPADFNDKDTLKFIVLMTDGQIGFQPRPTDANVNPDSRWSVTTRNISGNDANKKAYATTTNDYVGRFNAFTEAEAKGFYKKVCDYTKQEGITIFTIAFKVSAEIAANIAACASKPAYAYKVDGLDMSAAFQSIAAQMQQLRITK